MWTREAPMATLGAPIMSATAPTASFFWSSLAAWIFENSLSCVVGVRASVK